MKSSPVIEFEQVSKRFARHYDRHITLQEQLMRLVRRQPASQGNAHFWALRDVSFTMGRGEAIGLIGQNGSGKSTTLKLITRILEPTHGRIVVNGRISALLELGSGFHADLTGRENIYLNGSLLGQSHADMRHKIDDIIDFSELEEFIDTPVKHYSSGMYMRLAFAIAISVNPDILITDEVLAVGDDAFQRKCLDRIFRFKQQGCTILFVSHALGVVQNLCDRVLWFDHGILKQDSDPVSAIDAYIQLANEIYRKRMEEERRRQKERGEEESDQPEEHDKASNQEHTDEDEAEKEEPEDPQRWGTREVEITRVELLNSEGQPDEIVETNARMTVRMHYFAHQRVESPVFGVGIHHQNGLHISGPNTRFSNYPIDAVEGEGVIDYVIENLPLLQGNYVLSAAVYDHTISHPYDHHEQKYQFKVQATTLRERFGLFHIPSSWHWQPAGEETTKENGENEII
jgi:lipopolysaccharide transport system ATP-binding protein